MRRLRAARGLGQKKMAYECGINRTYLSSVERSERNMSIDYIPDREGLQIEPSRLLKDD
jgi:transcriptional regulator with XRE-family HTH domain